MRLLGKLSKLLFPPKCAVCGEIIEGGALCSECLEKYSREVKEKCSVCCHIASNCTCNSVSGFICLAFYRGYYSGEERVTEKLIYKLKRKRSIPLADFFAVDMATAILKHLARIGENKENCVITYIPRSTKSLSKYGFDQGELLSKRVSRFTGIEYEKMFIRYGGSEQKKMTSAERFENAADTIDISEHADVQGRHVIIIDDVLTTGATMSRGTELLYSAGAEKVTKAVIARTARKK